MIRACFDRQINVGILGQGLWRLFDPQVDQSDRETVHNTFDFDIKNIKHCFSVIIQAHRLCNTSA